MIRVVIIVAGGSGKRMQSDIPKQFIELCGLPILMHTIKAFYAFSTDLRIILVLPTDNFDLWNELCKKNNFNIPHDIVAGGEERYFSVKNALDTINEECLVAIHDGVRPFICNQVIGDCFDAAEKHGAAIPVTELKDSIRYSDESENYSVDRKKYKLVQTPQIFHSALIKASYSAGYSPEFTDDASVAESSGHKITLVNGSWRNIKITTAEDLYLAESLIKT